MIDKNMLRLEHIRDSIELKKQIQDIIEDLER
jgi:hypothetical protein